MGIHVISMCAILAIIPLYWLPDLPDLHLVWLLIAAGVALSVQQRKWLRFSGLALLFMCWGSRRSGKRMADEPFNESTAAGRGGHYRNGRRNDASGKDCQPQWRTRVGCHGRGAVWQLSAAKRLRGSTLGNDPAAQGGTRRTQRWRL